MSQKMANIYHQNPDREQKKRETRRYYSLTRNMLLVIILVAIMPMIVVSSIILYEFDISYHEKVHAHLEELVLKHKHNIDSFLKQKLGDIRFYWARLFPYEELRDESFLRDRLELLQEIYGPVFVDLGVDKRPGYSRWPMQGRSNWGRPSIPMRNGFKMAMKSDYFKSDVFLGLRGLPHFIIAVRENWNGNHGYCGPPLILWPLIILWKISVSEKPALPLS